MLMPGTVFRGGMGLLQQGCSLTSIGSASIQSFNDIDNLIDV